MAVDRLEEEELFSQAFADFPAREVQERTEGGRRYRYLKVDSILNRLNESFGPAGWSEHYQVLDDVTVVCTLTVTLPDGRVVTRQAPGKRKAATPHLRPDDKGALKPGDVGGFWQTAFTNALKVAARKLGVGHSLKAVNPRFVGPALARIAERERGTVAAEATPPAPAERVPATQTAPARPAAPAAPAPTRSPGRSLYNRAVEAGKKAEFDLVMHLTDWGSRQGFPSRIIDWGEDEARLGVAEAKRRLASLHSQEVPEDALAN